MNLSDIGLPLTGDALIESIHKAKEQRKAIAEGFLYEQSILMVAADPGLGKSTISTQVAIELAAGLPIFQVFNVSKPVKVLYIQTERSLLEFLERAEVISRKLPIVKENLFVTDKYKPLNLLNGDHVMLLAKCIQRDCPGVEVIIIDPIYSMVMGGLSKDEPASAFCRAMSYIQAKTNATLYYNHHTVKAQYSSMEGIRIDKDDPFYGSQWLKAHVTGSFYMKQSDKGVSLIKKKDNYKLLHDTIHLEYDPETELCIAPKDDLPAIERLKMFLNLRKIDKKEFTFSEMLQDLRCATRTLRTLLLHTSISEQICVVSSKRYKNLYKIKDT